MTSDPVSLAAVPDVTALVTEARRYLMRHNDAFYGPMKDERCGCSECKLIRALLTELERTRQERDHFERELQAAQANWDKAERERDAAVAGERELREALSTILTRVEDANQTWSRLDVGAIARAALAVADTPAGENK